MAKDKGRSLSAWRQFRSRPKCSLRTVLAVVLDRQHRETLHNPSVVLPFCQLTNGWPARDLKLDTCFADLKGIRLCRDGQRRLKSPSPSGSGPKSGRVVLCCYSAPVPGGAFLPLVVAARVCTMRLRETEPSVAAVPSSVAGRNPVHIGRGCIRSGSRNCEAPHKPAASGPVTVADALLQCRQPGHAEHYDVPTFTIHLRY